MQLHLINRNCPYLWCFLCLKTTCCLFAGCRSTHRSCTPDPPLVVFPAPVSTPNHELDWIGIERQSGLLQLKRFHFRVMNKVTPLKSTNSSLSPSLVRAIRQLNTLKTECFNAAQIAGLFEPHKFLFLFDFKFLVFILLYLWFFQISCHSILF